MRLMTRRATSAGSYCLVTLIGALLAQFYSHPFKMEHMDLLDATLLSCLFLIVWLSMAFEVSPPVHVNLPPSQFPRVPQMAVANSSVVDGRIAILYHCMAYLTSLFTGVFRFEER
jgi:hypothetical protein